MWSSHGPCVTASFKPRSSPPQDHPFYPSALLFGVSNTSMLRQSLGRFLQLGSRSIESLFSSDTHRKKGALKSSSNSTKKVSPLRQMNGYHSDGEALPLSVQLVRKEGTNSRSYVVLHFKEPTRGSRDFLMHLQRGPVEPQPDANSPDNLQALSPRLGMPLMRAHTATASTLGAGVPGAEEARVLRKLKSSNDQGIRQASPLPLVQAKPPPLTPLTGALALDSNLSPVEAAAPPPALPPPPPPPPPQQEQQPAEAPAQGSAPQEQQQQASPEGSADSAAKDDTSAGAKGGAAPDPGAPPPPQEPADEQAAAAAAAAGAPAEAARAPAALPPPPPPPLSLLAATALSQPRVATPVGNAPGRRQSSALAGAEAGSVASPVNPSQVLGLTLADYLVGAVERSAESEDDLAALFQQAVGEVKEAEEAAAAAAAAGGEAAEGEQLAQQQGQRVASGRSSGRAIAPRQAPAMRPVGLSNLSFNRKLAEQQAVEQQAAAEGTAAAAPAAGDTDETAQQLPVDSSVQLPPPPQMQAPSTDPPTTGGTGGPEAPAPTAPAASQPPAQQASPLGPTGKLTKVNSGSSASRVKVGPMGPPSPVQKAPPHASVSQPNTSMGMGPMRSQPPSSHHLLLAAQLKADLAAGRGGGSSNSLTGLAAAGRSGSQEPKAPLGRINSHESDFGKCKVCALGRFC